MLAQKSATNLSKNAAATEEEGVFPRALVRSLARSYEPILDVPYRERAIGAIIGIEKGARDQRGVAKRGPGCGPGRARPDDGARPRACTSVHVRGAFGFHELRSRAPFAE